MFNRRTFILMFIILSALLVVNSSTLAQSMDSDGDGVGDSRDQCPNEKGPASNNGCPLTLTIATPVPPADSDGDGIPDERDQCPREAGVAELNGCPVPPQQPPADPAQPPQQPADPAQPPQQPADTGAPANPVVEPTAVPTEAPFVLPVLPTDACYVTPAGDYRVLVRAEATTEAEAIGALLPGEIYAASGYVMSNGTAWFQMSAVAGFVSGDVVLTSACGELSPVRGGGR